MYNQLPTEIEFKFRVLSQQVFNKFGIIISEREARNLVQKWGTRNYGDKLKPNKKKMVITNRVILSINKALLEDHCLTVGKIKQMLNIIASEKTIRI